MYGLATRRNSEDGFSLRHSGGKLKFQRQVSLLAGAVDAAAHGIGGDGRRD